MKRDFTHFLTASAKFGRNNYEDIATEVVDKTAEEVAAYAKVFWKKYKTLHNWQKHLNTIEDGELRVRQSEQKVELLRRKIGMYRMPMQQMVIKYTVSTTNKKVYTEDEDRFLLVMLNKHGIEGDHVYEMIRDEIRVSHLFRFDWFFLSRTPQEIGRRCKTLIDTVVRELGGHDLQKGSKRTYDEDETEEEDEDEAPAKKKAKNGVKVCERSSVSFEPGLMGWQNKHLDAVKIKASPASSRASSVVSNGSATKAKAKGKGKKK
jgi:SWI/SNF-related matrix-associated actin-dependent regulator of chromatin subfamily A member 5